jgi:hypothetical protein
MMQNIRLIPIVCDRMKLLWIDAPAEIFERLLMQTKSIPHFLQPFTESADWITASQAGIQGGEVAAVALDPRFREGDDILSI